MLRWTAVTPPPVTSSSTQLDVTTLLVGIAVIVFSVALAQFVLIMVGIARESRARRNRPHVDRDHDGIHDDDDLLLP